MEKPGTNQETVVDSRKVASLAEEIRKAVPESPPLPGAAGGPGTSDAPGGEHKEAPRKEYTPDDVMELLTIPADAMYAITGKDRWILSDKEKKVLSEKGARALDLLLKLDPEKFVVYSFIAALGVIYGPRSIAEVRDMFKKGTPKEG